MSNQDAQTSTRPSLLLQPWKYLLQATCPTWSKGFIGTVTDRVEATKNLNLKSIKQNRYLYPKVSVSVNKLANSLNSVLEECLLVTLGIRGLMILNLSIKPEVIKS